jgi:hypothetical protein
MNEEITLQQVYEGLIVIDAKLNNLLAVFDKVDKLIDVKSEQKT